MKKRKFTKLLQRVPLWLLASLCAIVNLSNGAVAAIINVKESKIVHGFTLRLFITLLVLYGIVILINLCNKFFYGAYRGKEINNQYSTMLNQVLDSKISDIQSVSSGKVFDTVKELASTKAAMKLSAVWIVTAAIPAVTLIVKEFMYKPITAVISLISIPSIIVLSFMAEKWFSFSKEEKAKKATLQGICSDNFLNAKTIKYLGTKKYAEQRLKEAQDDAWITTINSGKIWYFRIIDVMAMVPLLLNVFICRNNLEMVALIVVSNWTLENMRNNVVDVVEHVIEIKSLKDIIKDLKGDDEENKIQYNQDIILDKVFFDYGEDTTKFYVDHLEFKKGSKTLVVGQSGSGKSSLANLLAGTIRPTTGHVPEMNVFYVWQETETFDDTLWGNIVFDNPYGVTEDDILTYFEKLDMLDWFQKELKDGFQTMVGERGCKISSGQKQRINIIRTIIELKAHPEKVFIMDEITSNLDDKTKRLAIELFKENISPETTCIIISHNDGFEQLCDEKIIVENHKFINGEI